MSWSCKHARNGVVKIVGGTCAVMQDSAGEKGWPQGPMVVGQEGHGWEWGAGSRRCACCGCWRSASIRRPAWRALAAPAAAAAAPATPCAMTWVAPSRWACPCHAGCSSGVCFILAGGCWAASTASFMSACCPAHVQPTTAALYCPERRTMPYTDMIWCALTWYDVHSSAFTDGLAGSWGSPSIPV